MVTTLTPNSQEELITIMKNSPPKWLPFVPWMDAPNIESLLERLIQHNAHLTEEWETKHSTGLRHKEQNVSHREHQQPNYLREEHSAHQVLAYDQEVDGEEPEEQESKSDEVEVTAMKSDSLPSRSSNRPHSVE